MVNKEQIQTSLRQLRELECIKSRPTFLHTLSDLENRMNDDTFRIAVVGEFSSGKSTFINALIGRDILTHAVNETTAAITYIHNVVKNDPRLNTCDITYNDGKITSVNELNKISEYTTAQSKLSVADKIASVSVYVNFLNTSVPFVIVDTPGLNGIASGHRNITIREIGKAHACIYLVSLRGLTKSDAEFVRFLSEYQSEFIFVQNFIDELKASDGESPESKLNDLRSAVDEYLRDTEINYSVCGISALKALVGKDDRIECLYSSDTEKITPKARQEIYRQSQFGDFEKILDKLITSGRYREVVSQSVIQSMKFIIRSMLPGMQQQLADEEEIVRSDKGSSAAEIATRRIEMIKNSREKNCTKLSNFISSRNKELVGNLKGYVSSELTAVYDAVCQSIEKKLKTYDDYNEIYLRTGGDVSEIFTSEVNRSVRSNIVPEVNRTIINGYNDIYSAALVRAAEYSGMVEKNKSYEVDVDSKFEEIKVNNADLERKIASVRFDIERKQEEAMRHNRDAAEARKAMGALNDTGAEEAKRQMDQLKSKIDSMGRMPDIEYKKEAHTRKKSGRSFFVWAWDKITGNNYETYYETVPDDSKQRKWREDHDRLVGQFMLRSQDYERCKMALKKQQDILSDKAAKSTQQSETAKRSIESLKRKLDDLEFQYNEAIRLNKNEYCQSIRKELKLEYESEIIDQDNGDSLVVRLTQYVEKMGGINKDKVTQLALEQLNSGFDASIKRLEGIVASNDNRIEEIMATSRREVEVLNFLLESAEKIGG